MRSKIRALESELLKMPQVDLRVEHYFTDGVYVREMYIPKGTLMTGGIYKKEHIHIISAGSMEIVTEDGGIRTVTAPLTFIAKPGMKRAGFATEDTVWSAVFVTNLTDPDEIVAEFTTDEYPSLEGNKYGSSC